VQYDIPLAEYGLIYLATLYRVTITALQWRTYELLRKHELGVSFWTTARITFCLLLSVKSQGAIIWSSVKNILPVNLCGSLSIRQWRCFLHTSAVWECFRHFLWFACFFFTEASVNTCRINSVAHWRKHLYISLLQRQFRCSERKL